MRIYLTHCTGVKDDTLRKTGEKVTPDQLYQSIPIQRFFTTCKAQRVAWAIFSDKHGIWFPNLKHGWYDKHPDDVSKDEFEWLVENFDDNLNNFSEIWFYNNPAWFHSLYSRILEHSSLKDRIKLFSHLAEIT